MQARLRLLVLALGSLGVSVVCAQPPVTWSATPIDADFNNAANWIGGLPAASDLVFGASTGQNPTLSASISVNSLAFTGAYPSYTLAAAASTTPTLSLGAGGVSLAASGTNTVAFTSTLPLALTAAQTWTIDGTLSVSSVISDSGGAALTKAGSGVLLLEGANTYSGGTTVSSGSLVVNNPSGSATGSGAVTIASGATLQIGFGSVNGSVSGAITDNGTVIFWRSNAVSAGGISGTGSVSQAGSGTLTLTGSNTYTGPTYLGSTTDHGTIDDAAAGAFSPGSMMLIFGGTLHVKYDETIRGLGDFVIVDATSPGRSVIVESGKTLALSGAGSTFSGVISGAGGLTIGSGVTETLQGTNTYTGATTIAGTLALGTTGFLSDTTAVNLSADEAVFDLRDHNDLVTIGSLAGVDGTSVILRGTGRLKIAANTSTTFSGKLDGTPDTKLIKEGGGTLTLDAASSSASHPGTIVIDNGAVRIGHAGTLNAGTDITVAGGALEVGADQTIRALTGTGSVSIEDGRTLTLNLPGSGAGSTAAFSGNITDVGSGLLVKDGPGTFTFTGVLDQGSSHITTLASSGSHRRIPRGAVTPATLLEVKSGTFQLGDGTTDGRIDGGIAIDSAGTLVFKTAAATTTFGDLLSGCGTLVKDGAAVSNLTLTGLNSFDGAVSIVAGTLTVGADDALTSGTAVEVGATANSARFAVGPSASTGATIGSLSGTGSVTIASGKSLTVAGDDDTTYSGAISDPGSLVKSGGGTLTLSGTNTYAGGTTVSGGELRVSAGSISHPTADLVVGKSECDSGALTISSGGSVSANYGWIGKVAGSTGFVELFDSASLLVNSSTLYVGYEGDGSLAIFDGASASSAGGILGSGADSHGFAVVEGSGSVWTLNAADPDHALTVGREGTGLLALANGGTLNANNGAGTITLGSLAGGSGMLLIGSTPHDDPIASGGILKAATVTTGTGHGAVLFATDADAETPYYFTKDGLVSGAAIMIAGWTQVGNVSGVNVLNGANTYAGGTDIWGGTLVAASDTALGTGPVHLTNDATLVLSSADPRIGGLSDDSHSHGHEVPSEATGTLLLQPSVHAFEINQSVDGEFGGLITGGEGPAAAKFIKTGTATFTLSGANAYAGGTDINQGILVAGSATALGTGPITVNPGSVLGLSSATRIANQVSLAGTGGSRAFLAGFGTVAPLPDATTHLSAITVGSGDGLSPGAKLDSHRGPNDKPVGTLSLGYDDDGTHLPASVTFEAGGLYDWGVQTLATPAGTGSDLVAVTGSLTFNLGEGDVFKFRLTTFEPNGALGPLAGLSLTETHRWTILTASTGITGFNAAAMAIDASGFANFSVNGAFSIVHTGNALFLDFNPAAVPEPATWALLLTGLAVVGFVARRRRSR